MVSRNRKIARRIGQAVANDVLDITGAVSGGAGVTVYATADDLPTTGLTAGDEAFVSSSNRLYISNGTGWYSIGLINTNPSITSAGDANYTMSYGTPINITVDASDPEQLPLTYSYYTTDSIGNAATITNDSSVFTITPTSNLNIDATFGLLFRASDGINVASSSTSNFTLFNQPPSLSGNDSSYVLSPIGSAMTISLNSTDPEGQAITYTATGDAGFNAIATFSNDSSVFTVTPKSQAQAPNGGTGTLTFTVSDGIKTTDGLSSFSLTFAAPAVQDTKYTTLLVTGNGTSGNSTFTDGSASNHSFNLHSTPESSTFSPYRHGGYSTYFDGTTNTYLNVSGGVALGSGDFTMSFWVYSNDISSPNYLVDFRPLNVNTASYPHIRIDHNSGCFKWAAGGVDLLVGNTVVSSKEWIYFCIARDNGVTKMYVNGIQQNTTYSGTQNFTNGTNRPVIGTGAYAITPMFDGYISDLRIVTSLDTTAYSVPTNRMSAITNTQLLTCHLPYIADGSSNGHTITVNGNVSLKPITPYDYPGYTTDDHGGSVYFNGDIDKLQINSSTDFEYSTTEDFTVELWAYPTAAWVTGDVAVASGAVNGTNSWLLMIATDKLLFRSNGQTNIELSSAKLTGWNHVAVVRSSNNVNLYLNGVSVGSGTYNNSIGINQITIGGQPTTSSNNYTGYISDLRMVKGTAIYSGNFTPPKGPLTTTGGSYPSTTNVNTSITSSNTKLLLSGTDASIIDKSQAGDILELSGSIVGSTWTPFTNYYSVDLRPGHISIPSRDEFILGSEDFTIEMWYSTTATSPTWARLIECGAYNIANTWRINNYSNTTKVAFQIGDPGTRPEIVSTTAKATWAWGHVAVTRSGNTIRLFIDGTQEGGNLSYSGSLVAPPNGSLLIGAGTEYGNIVNSYNGLLQDLRITKGLARYTSNFTAPTAPLEG